MARSKASTSRNDGAAGKLTDKAGRGVSKALAAAGGDSDGVAGPSSNPATNLIIHDIVMRSGGRLMRHALEKGLLRTRYGTEGAKTLIENRSLPIALASYLVSRVATRSLPGAAIVGGGLIAKTLYDRRRSRKASKRAGDKALRRMADE